MVTTNAAIIGATIAASSASSSAHLTNASSQGAVETATAYVLCDNPSNDGCIVDVDNQLFRTTNMKYDWATYASWKLGYSVSLVGIQFIYNPRDVDPVIIYVRKVNNTKSQ